MWVYIVLLSIYPVWCQHTVSGCFVFRAYSAASRHKAAQRFWWWWAPPRRWPRRAASGKSAPVGGDGRTTQRCHSGHNSILSTPNDRHPPPTKEKEKKWSGADKDFLSVSEKRFCEAPGSWDPAFVTWLTKTHLFLHMPPNRKVQTESAEAGFFPPPRSSFSKN